MKYLKGNFAVFMEPDPCQGSGYWNFIEMEKEKKSTTFSSTDTCRVPVSIYPKKDLIFLDPDPLPK